MVQHAAFARHVGLLMACTTYDALEQPGQVFAVDRLHGYKVRAVPLGDVVEAADVRMRYLPPERLRRGAERVAPPRAPATPEEPELTTITLTASSTRYPETASGLRAHR